MFRNKKMGQIQKQSNVAEDSHSTESSELSFDEIDDNCGSAKENGDSAKIVLLEARLQMVEAETKLLKEKIQLLEEKQIQPQGKKCSESNQPQEKKCSESNQQTEKKCSESNLQKEKKCSESNQPQEKKCSESNQPQEKKCSESNQPQEKKCSESETINEVQQKIDESDNEIVTQNAEYRKQMQKLEIERKLALKAVEEKYQKKFGELEAKKLPKGVVQLNPGLSIGNRWTEAKNSSISISTDGLKMISKANFIKWHSVSTEKGFIISADSTRPALYYFEVMANREDVGLSTGNIPTGSIVGLVPNSYAFQEGDDYCFLSGESHDFELPDDAMELEWNGPNVLGCGIFLSAEKKLFIFFTVNGTLMGKQIPINPTVNTLYPTISIKGEASVEANFGEDQQAKPFKYDIKKCPGLVLD